MGYMKGKVESFEVRLSGTKYPYEYIPAGRVVAGVTYYLQANNRVIYRVEFAGPPDKLRKLSDQTDFIARGFRLKWRSSSHWDVGPSS